MSAIPSPVLTDRYTCAFDFASVVHSPQVRKGTCIPYISHLLGVASLVIEHGADEDTAIAALLHDAVEDGGGPPMLAQVRARFGERVARIVMGCTDAVETPKPPWLKRKQEYLQHLATDASLESCMVSAADKLHNARALLHDLRAIRNTEEVWSRFSAREEFLGWYYGGVESKLETRLATHDAREMVEELRHALDAIGRLDGAASKAFARGRAGAREGRVPEGDPERLPPPEGQV